MKYIIIFQSWGEKTKETARDQTELKREFILEDSSQEITNNAAKKSKYRK